ncbi:MAG: FAD-binding protein [Chloroflexi bacterium]|nr:FAD-binding protein [Chloroflexota bacterium]
MLSATILNELRAAVSPGRVLSAPEELIVYGYDGAFVEHRPDVVVAPASTAEVSRVLRIANRERIPVAPRGAGTGLAGGSVPVAGGIALNMAMMNRIVEIAPGDMCVVTQPGVVTGALQSAVEAQGLFYPPDPASLNQCTIGGNIGTSAGGPRGLKYGTTKDYVLGLEVVLANGDVLRTGGRAMKNVTGYNLTQLFVGSEGTLGVVTEITLRLLPKPLAKATVLAIYNSLDAACQTVGNILGASVVPVTTELMDNVVIKAVEDAFHLGLPTDAGALLLIEVDGDPQTVPLQQRTVAEICAESGAREVRIAKDAAEANALWQARRDIYAAIMRLKPNTLPEDICVPRSKIPEMARRVSEVREKYGLAMPMWGHVGDGNLHPSIMCDRRDADEMRRVHAALSEIFAAAIELGGTLTGEHGIGVLKKEYLPTDLSATAIAQMKAIKQLFDPNGILNPGKLFPD